MSTHTVAEVVVEHLVKAGVKRIYGIVGDSLNPISDALRRDGTIDAVLGTIKDNWRDMV